jgi:hypothetical protein
MTEGNWQEVVDERRRARVQRLAKLAHWLDAAVTVPGTSIKLGADAIIGLVPGVGDVVTTGISLYIVVEGYRLGAKTKTIAKMVGNVAIDFLLSEIVVVGDIADVFFKANKRNIAILAKDLNLPELVPEAYRVKRDVKRVENEAISARM